LVAAAEQVYIAGAHAGWAKDDDSTIWRLFLPGYPIDAIFQMTKKDSTLIARNDAISIQDVIDLFAGSHLATAVEAMGFTEAVGLDTDVMYDIISKAAGANTQFIDCVPKMKKPTWTLKGVLTAKEISDRLVRLFDSPYSDLSQEIETNGL
jgi:3-hydroxyisobutyrate dehydrogenase